MRALAPTLAALLCIVGAAEATQPPPVTLPAGLADVGAATARPFGLLCAGQSNAVGRDAAGSKAIGPNILITNAFQGGTTFIAPVFGAAPLNLSAGGTSTTTSAVAADNNQCVQFANSLRASGVLPATRPIVIILNATGGQPISQWIGTGTSSPYWTTLVASLAAASAAYPGFALDHVIWAQGEGDNDTSGSANASMAGYLTGFSTLLAQWRTLPQWLPTTTVSVTELAPFYDNTQQERNDALRTLRDGLFDPFVTAVSGSGLAESTEAPPYHYAGTGLVTLGQRHFQAWLQARISGGYHSGALSANTGSAAVTPDRLVMSGGNTTVSPDNLRSGMATVDATLGGVLLLPPPKYSGQATLYVYASTPGVTFNANPATITFENRAPVTAGFLAPATNQGTQIYRVVSNPIANTWSVETIFPRVGGTVLPTATFTGAGQTMTAQQTRGGIYQLSVATLALPTSGVPDGSTFTFYNQGGGTSTLNASGTPDMIYNTAGIAATAYTMQPGTIATLMALRSHWFVLSETAAQGRKTQFDTPTSGATVTTPSGFGKVTHIISPSGTIASLTIALPSGPLDGAEVTYVATQAVTSVTFTNGTILTTTLPTGFTAGQKVTLTFYQYGTKWF